LVLLATPASAEEIIKTCALVEVRSVHVSAEGANPKDATSAKIDVSRAQLQATLAGEIKTVVTVVALGPVLGSMDSTDVRTDLACTAKGIRLTATITRSAHYNGAALKNVLWRPEVTLAVSLNKDEVIFESVWAMRLSTGVNLDHAQTPSQPDQTYPITVTRTLSPRAP